MLLYLCIRHSELVVRWAGTGLYLKERRKEIALVEVNRAHRVTDQSALTIVYHLLRDKGLFLGLSSGINIAAAVKYAEESAPGQIIVTILYDSGHKYQPKLFNNQWLAEHGLCPGLPSCVGAGRDLKSQSCLLALRQDTLRSDPPRCNRLPLYGR